MTTTEAGTLRLLIACLTAIALTGIAFGYAACEQSGERRLECIRRTSDAAACRLLFPGGVFPRGDQ